MNGKALVVFLGPLARSQSNNTSALLSKTSEEVTEVLRQNLETFQLMTELSSSTAALELSVQGNARYSVLWPEVKNILSRETMHPPMFAFWLGPFRNATIRVPHYLGVSRN